MFALLAIWASSCRADVAVTNIAAETTLRYPVALLEGTSDAPESSTLTVENETSKKASRQFKTTTVGGRFKALMELAPGPNALVLDDGQKPLHFSLNYQPMTTPYMVRIIYLTDDTGKTTYATPRANDPQDYKAKLDTVTKLMQTATAESLNAAGLGRRTFRLETDANGDVVVHTVNSRHPVSYFHAITDDQQLYRDVDQLLEPRFPTDHVKNVVLMGFSEYDAVHHRPLSHTALGGGGQGLFGTLDLFSWPSNLQEVQQIFNDKTPIDPDTAFDDSGYRGRLWGLSATTIGATLHETGHALGLPHSPQRYSVMSRGFDQINRMFSLTEPVKGANQPPRHPKPNEVGMFDRVSADRLAYTHWFEMDRKTYTKAPPPKISVDEKTGNIEITAPAGLRFVGVDRDQLSRESQVFATAPPKTMEFKPEELKKQAGGDKYSLLAIDDNANETSAEATALASPPNFIRNWKFSPETLPWPDDKQLPTIIDATAKQIAEQLSAQPTLKCQGAFINLIQHYAPKVPTERRHTFALSEINSPTDQQAILLTGSDDGLRVWVNGQLVLTKVLLRGATPDDDATPITLHAGRNTILVEVFNGGGDWGFLARLATPDPARLPLLVNDQGQVAAPPAQ